VTVQSITHSLFLGIDVGLDGAIAAIAPGAPMPAIFPMPTYTVEVTKKRKGKTVKVDERRLDESRVLSILEQLRDQATDLYVLIERPQLRPAAAGATPCPLCGMSKGQSLTAQVKFHGQFDVIRGMLLTLKVPFEDIHPATWKADVFHGTSDKTDARTKAAQLYPAIASKLTRVKDDGLAEAVLLADYAKRRRNAALTAPF